MEMIFGKQNTIPQPGSGILLTMLTLILQMMPGKRLNLNSKIRLRHHPINHKKLNL